ncbi:1-phosphofructokinase [Staphylococcus durrellii]|uniref:1-phosphofructokinase n=1 Tax=Staphylococcus durrellii TaxID=2781773 RepID=UPI00189DE45A|nr:1-phosphofructokinase [Staphylococcus durrellii]MBF7017680.1 1-phosphofructokinase [Staphylococcus durrellii]
MIYTVTFNPSIDYIMVSRDFQIDGLNRASSTQKFAGGKGINVSRVLQTLNITSTALGFVGGFPGDFIKAILSSSNIVDDFIVVDEDTRINVKLKTENETEINAPGPHITEEQLDALLGKIKKTTEQDIVIVAGSVPTSIGNDIYENIAKITNETGAQLVVDAEKHLVESVLSYGPLFIKPNKDELEAMFNVSINSDAEVVKYGREILAQGAKSVIVSLGGAGAIYIDNQQSFKATVPKGKVINTVGSGDSTVAGMVAGLTSGYSIESAFKLAVAAGTATAFNDDLAQNEAIKNIESQVEISKLDGSD